MQRRQFPISLPARSTTRFCPVVLLSYLAFSPVVGATTDESARALSAVTVIGAAVAVESAVVDSAEFDEPQAVRPRIATTAINLYIRTPYKGKLFTTNFAPPLDTKYSHNHAPGETRTRKTVRPTDFKSVVYTDSTTGATSLDEKSPLLGEGGTYLFIL